VCVLLIVKCGAVTTVGSFPPALGLGSFGVETVTVLVTGEAVAAATATFTVSVNTLLVPLAIGPASVQVTTCGGPAVVTTQFHAALVFEASVSPVGSVSVTVMVSEVGAVPPLVTVMV